MNVSRMQFIDFMHSAVRAYKRAINCAPQMIGDAELRKRGEEAVLESVPFAKENGNELLGMITDRVEAIYRYGYDKDYVGIYREMEYSWELFCRTITGRELANVN